MEVIYKDDCETAQVVVNGETFRISEHACQRLSERYNWNRKTILRIMKKVFERGERAVNRKDHVAAWARLKEKENGFNITIYTYGQEAFFVSKNNILITVYSVPNKAAGKLYYERHNRDAHSECMKQKKKMNRRVLRSRMPIPTYAS